MYKNYSKINVGSYGIHILETVGYVSDLLEREELNVLWEDGDDYWCILDQLVAEYWRLD